MEKEKRERVHAKKGMVSAIFESSSTKFYITFCTSRSTNLCLTRAI